MQSEQHIARHYGEQDIIARIDVALAGAGVDPLRPERRDLTPFDEFHGGGIVSTRDLAAFAELKPGMHVADIGCGIGGPARTLAAEFGCRISGVDLTDEFVRAAQILTTRLGLATQCDFSLGDAGRVPLPDAQFDCVWSQNMLMNVADKAAFFAEVVRLLKPAGRFAFEAVLEGNGEPVHLPAFWADSADINHLVTRERLEALLTEAGLEQLALEDTTTAVIANARKRNAAIANASPATLTIAVIVPDDVELKMNNAMRNNEQGRTITVKGVYRKPA